MGVLLTLIQKQMIKRAVRYAAKDPEKNIETILNHSRALLIKENHKRIFEKIRPPLLNRDSNWHMLAVRMLTDTAPKTREKLAVNIIANAISLGIPTQDKNKKKYGCGIPWALLIDLTERCNLKCKGCWASGYKKEVDLDSATIDRVIAEGKELGIYFYVISGGEPLVRKNELLALAKKHHDTVFMVFTNGTLIDKTLAQAVAGAGNIILALSIEGPKESTDARRGQGVYAKVMAAMDLLHAAGAFYGFSTTYTRENADEVSSDEFIDTMVSKGCFFGWFFTYVPVGGEIDLNYMATPQQRAYMYEMVRHFRQTKPIFLADFWNDGEAVGGCIAGGRSYLHITAAGEVEPCAFIHYSTCNIKNMSLLEALGSPLMMAYQRRQPFNSNHLCPCPLIDNPQALADMVSETGAYSTQTMHPGAAQSLADKLKPYSEEWGKIAAELKEK